MKTDVDTALKEIADWYVKNRREMSEPELETILVKHCEDEAEIQNFTGFLETEPGELRFKTLLRERKGGGSNPEKYSQIEELGHEVYGLVYKHADDGWDFIHPTKLTRTRPPYWEEFRDTFIKELAKELKEGPPVDLYGIRAKDKAIGIMLEKYRDNFPEAVIQRFKGTEYEEATMFFNVPEAREYLIKKGLVYTLRPKLRKTGRDTAFYSTGPRKLYDKEKIGPVWVDFIKEVKEPGEVQEYVSDSGFANVEDWWKEAKGSRFLYKVTER